MSGGPAWGARLARLARPLASPVGLFVAAAAVRIGVGLALLAASGDRFPQASDDGDSYDAAARWLVWGDPLVHGRLGESVLDTRQDQAARWPAGYWLFLAGLYRALGYGFLPPIVLQALLGAAGAVALLGLGRRALPNNGWALAAGYLAALAGTLVALSATLSAEALYVPLLLLGTWTVGRAAEAGRGQAALGWGLVGGALFGLAEATRPVALPIFAAALAWLAWRGHDGGPRWLPVGGAALGFGLAILPFVARDLLVLGRVALFTVGGAEALTVPVAEPDLTDRLAQLGVNPYARGIGGALAAVAARPAEVWSLLAEALPGRLGTLFLVGGWGPIAEPLPTLLGSAGIAVRALLWVLAGLGAVATLRAPDSGRRATGWLLLLVVAAVILPALLLGKPLVRYRAPADALVCVWAVAGLAWLAALARRAPATPSSSAPTAATQAVAR